MLVRSLRPKPSLDRWQQAQLGQASNRDRWIPGTAMGNSSINFALVRTQRWN
jgi:hypothetical protein